MSNPTPTNKTIDEALNGDELHLLIFKHLEEMLENPDEHGIYPTTKFMVDLKQALLTYIKEEVTQAEEQREFDLMQNLRDKLGYKDFARLIDVSEWAEMKLNGVKFRDKLRKAERNRLEQHE
jgi:hypothetical protein